MSGFQQAVAPLENENGFALISVILILAILTFIGIAGTNTAVFELKIAGNERQAYQKFYVADSGWKQAGPFLNAMAAPPKFVNLTLNATFPSYDWTNQYFQIVRNFGEGTDGTLNDNFPANTEDGAIVAIPYWYRLLYQDDVQAIGFGTGYREFQYGVDCNAQGNTEVATRVKKVFRVGY